MTKVNDEEIVYTEMPEITGRVEIIRVYTDEGILYKVELKDGDIIGVTLQLIQEGIGDLIQIYGDTISFCHLNFTILGYRSPSILVCKYIRENND